MSENGFQGYRTMFIYLSWVCYMYNTWISQTKHKTERNTNSQTFYKNYISSVNYTHVINYPVN